MIGLEIYHKGEKVATICDSRTGMASFSVNTQCFEKGDQLDRAYASGSGFYGEGGKFLNFLHLEDLKIGDEFTVKICDAEQASEATEEEVSVIDDLTLGSRLKNFFFKWGFCK